MFLGLSIEGVGLNKNMDMLYFVVICDFILVLCLTLILSPPRQTIQDWARYRHEHEAKKGHQSKFSARLKDLIFGEKSPAIEAIAVNLIIVTIPLAIWILTIPTSIYRDYGTEQSKILLSLVFFASLMMMYATISQLMLLIKNPKRYVFAVVTIGGVMLLPVIFLSFLDIRPIDNPSAWLFSSFPWMGLEKSGLSTIFMALLGEITVTVLLNFKLNKQVKVLGESATKALLASR
jgi:hypothetical protein